MSKKFLDLTGLEKVINYFKSIFVKYDSSDSTLSVGGGVINKITIDSVADGSVQKEETQNLLFQYKDKETNNLESLVTVQSGIYNVPEFIYQVNDKASDTYQEIFAYPSGRKTSGSMVFTLAKRKISDDTLLSQNTRKCEYSYVCKYTDAGTYQNVMMYNQYYIVNFDTSNNPLATSRLTTTGLYFIPNSQKNSDFKLKITQDGITKKDGKNSEVYTTDGGTTDISKFAYLDKYGVLTVSGKYPTSMQIYNSDTNDHVNISDGFIMLTNNSSGTLTLQYNGIIMSNGKSTEAFTTDGKTYDLTQKLDASAKITDDELTTLFSEIGM